jgi:hypothetical protein
VTVLDAPRVDTIILDETVLAETVECTRCGFQYHFTADFGYTLL